MAWPQVAAKTAALQKLLTRDDSLHQHCFWHQQPAQRLVWEDPAVQAHVAQLLQEIGCC